MSKTFQFDTATLVDGLRQSLADAVSTEKQLGADAVAELSALSESLVPFAVGLAAELAGSKTPEVQQQYLAGLPAIMESKVAELAGNAILVHKALIASEVQKWVGILGMVLKAAAAVALAA